MWTNCRLSFRLLTCHGIKVQFSQLRIQNVLLSCNLVDCCAHVQYRGYKKSQLAAKLTKRLTAFYSKLNYRVQIQLSFSGLLWSIFSLGRGHKSPLICQMDFKVMLATNQYFILRIMLPVTGQAKSCFSLINHLHGGFIATRRQWANYESWLE